jgi:hypothetical protein
VGAACGTYGGENRCVQGYGEEPKEKHHLEDLGMDGRIILNGSKGTGWGSLDCMHLGQDLDELWV